MRTVEFEPGRKGYAALPPVVQMCPTAAGHLLPCCWFRITSILTRSSGATTVLLTMALIAPHDRCLTVSLDRRIWFSTVCTEDRTTPSVLGSTRSAVMLARRTAHCTRSSASKGESSH